MENITEFVIIDCQGFMKEGKFIPCEFDMGFVNENQLILWDVNVYVDFRCLSPKDQVKNEFIKDHVTGLSYNVLEDAISIEKLKTFLKVIWECSGGPKEKPWPYGI